MAKKNRTLDELRQVKTYGYKHPAKKSKYDRRRAIDCQLERKSKSNPGYCKYIVTICELDGTIHKQPAYGKDMQDALSRLMKKEVTIKVEKRLEKNVGLIAIAWRLMIGWPALIMAYSKPYVFFIGIGTIILLFFAVAWWMSYVRKGDE